MSTELAISFNIRLISLAFCSQSRFMICEESSLMTRCALADAKMMLTSKSVRNRFCSVCLYPFFCALFFIVNRSQLSLICLSSPRNSYTVSA